MFKSIREGGCLKTAAILFLAVGGGFVIGAIFLVLGSKLLASL
jgi:hypothetical protein